MPHSSNGWSGPLEMAANNGDSEKKLPETEEPLESSEDDDDTVAPALASVVVETKESSNATTKGNAALLDPPESVDKGKAPPLQNGGIARPMNHADSSVGQPKAFNRDRTTSSGSTSTVPSRDSQEKKQPTNENNNETTADCVAAAGLNDDDGSSRTAASAAMDAVVNPPSLKDDQMAVDSPEDTEIRRWLLAHEVKTDSSDAQGNSLRQVLVASSPSDSEESMSEVLMEGIHKLVNGRWECVSAEVKNQDLHKLRDFRRLSRSRRASQNQPEYLEECDSIWFDNRFFESDGFQLYPKSSSNKRFPCWEEVKLTHRSNKRLKSEAGVIRIGSRYQAEIPACTADYTPDPNEVPPPERLWDSQKAIEAEGHGVEISRFLSTDVDFNTRILLMEGLHKTDYTSLPAARDMYNQLFQQQRPKYKHDWSDSDSKKVDEWCGDGIVYPEKNFKEAASRLGCSEQAVQVFYYNWKATNLEYKRIKQKKHEEPDECCRCRDGGRLIICDNCRKAYHFKCHNPPLESVPETEWYCSTCTEMSPAKLRHLVSAPMLDESGTAKRRLRLDDQTKEKTKASLRNIMKEITVGQLPKNSRKNNTYTPSKMTFDANSGCWVDNLGDSRSPNEEAEILTRHPYDSAEENLMRSPDDESEESDSNESAEGAKESPKGKTSSDESDEESATEEDPTFEPEEDEDDDEVDDEVLLVDVKPPPGARQKQPVQWSTPSLLPLPNASATRPLQAHPVVYTCEIPFVAGRLGIMVAQTASKNGVGMVFKEFVGDRKRLAPFHAHGDQFLEIDGWSCSGKNYDEMIERITARLPGQAHKKVKMLHVPKFSQPTNAEPQSSPKAAQANRTDGRTESHQAPYAPSKIPSSHPDPGPIQGTVKSNLANGTSGNQRRDSKVFEVFGKSVQDVEVKRTQSGPGSQAASADGMAYDQRMMSGLVQGVGWQGSHPRSATNTLYRPIMTGHQQLDFNHFGAAQLQGSGQSSAHPLSTFVGIDNNSARARQISQRLPPVQGPDEGAFRLFCFKVRPELYDCFLRKGIRTLSQFMNANMDELAAMVAQETNMTVDFARDFLGGMRLDARVSFGFWDCVRGTDQRRGSPSFR